MRADTALKSGLLLVILTVPAFANSVHNHRELSNAHTHGLNWLGQGSFPHLNTTQLRAVAVVNPFNFCWDIVFGIVYTVTLLTPHVDVYVSLKDQHLLGSFTSVGADATLKTINDRPALPIEQLPGAGQQYDLVIYADWYGPMGPVEADKSLPGGRYPCCCSAAALASGFVQSC